MRFLQVTLVLAVSFAFAAPSAAQTCASANADHYYLPQPACANDCRVGTTVAFAIASAVPQQSPTSCASVQWTGVAAAMPGNEPRLLTLTSSGPYGMNANITVGTQTVLRETSVYASYGTMRVVGSPIVVDEDAGLLTITVERTSGVNSASSSWLIDSAAFGRLGAISGTVHFPTGATTQQINIPIIDDNFNQGPRTYFFVLGGNADYPVSGPSPSYITIVDDDVPAILGFASSPMTFAENIGNAAVAVKRTGNMETSGSVDYEVAANGRIGAVAGKLTFGAGEASKTFYVPIANDDVYTGSTSTQVRLINPSAGFRFGTFSGSQLTGTLTVTEDDAPATLGFTVPGMIVAETAGTVTFTVQRAGNTNGTVSVHYGASNSNRIAPLSGTLTFGPNETSKSFTVTILNDDVYTASPAISIALSEPVGAILKSPSTVSLTVTDDEEQPVLAFAMPVFSVAENAGTTTITVVRSGNVNTQVGVSYSAPAWWTSSPLVAQTGGTLVFAPGETSKSFSVVILDNQHYNNAASNNITMVLWNPTGGARFASSIFEQTATLKILDDEGKTTIGFASPLVETHEGAGSVNIVVNRSGDLTTTATVRYVVDESPSSSVVARQTGTLTFGPSETTKIIVVPIVDDDVYAGPQQSAIELSNAVGAELAPSMATLKVEDNERRPMLSVEGKEILEGNDGFAEATAFVIRLDQPLGQAISIHYLITRGSTQPGDFASLTSSVSIPAGETEGEVRVQVRGDRITESDEHFYLRISQWFPAIPGLRNDIATATILNDDAGLGPNDVRIARGTTGEGVIDIGAAAAADLVVALASSNSGAVSVPETITIAAGTRRAAFPMYGVAAGSATIRATVSGQTLAINATTYESAKLVFSPAHVSGFTGQDIEVKVSLDPPSAQPQTIALSITNKNVAAVAPSVTIPAGGTGTFIVKALAPGGTAIHATLPAENGGMPQILDVSIAENPNAPTLAALTPATGPNAGGTKFEAAGARLTADCTISFGGVPATDVVVVGDALVTGITPAHAAGTVDATLHCGAQQFVLARAFTFVAAQPSLRAVAPSFGNVAGGTHVRATGANLYSGCWLFFGGAPARGVVTHGTTEMTAVTPAGSNGASDVSVRCGEMTSILKNGFTYTPAAEPSPSISSIDPLVGSAGEPVTITGSRFRPTDRIAFDDQPATLLRTTPDTHVVRIPALPLGMTSITLTDAEGRATTTGPIFAIVEPLPPQIASITPSAAAPGAELVLEGRGFRPGYTFVVGGKDAKLVALDYTRAVIRIAADAAFGEQRVDVLNAAKQLASRGPAVTIGDGIRVSTVSPACGTSEGGTIVTISGANFVEGATVTFNGAAAANVTFVSATELRAQAPAGATGAARVVVTNPDRSAASLSDGFRFVSPFDPDGGCESGGRTRAVRR